MISNNIGELKFANLSNLQIWHIILPCLWFPKALSEFVLFRKVTIVKIWYICGCDTPEWHYHEGAFIMKSVRQESWWRHQMETFSVLLDLCVGNSLVTGEFPSQRTEMHSFDVFFDLHLYKRLNKQLWRWWFEMPSRSFWCHFNGCEACICLKTSCICLFHEDHDQTIDCWTNYAQAAQPLSLKKSIAFQVNHFKM